MTNHFVSYAYKPLFEYLEPVITSSVGRCAAQFLRPLTSWVAEYPLIATVLVLTSIVVVRRKPKSEIEERAVINISTVSEAKRILRYHRGTSPEIPDDSMLNREDIILTCSEEQTRKFHNVFNRIFKAVGISLPSLTQNLAINVLEEDQRFKEKFIHQKKFHTLAYDPISQYSQRGVEELLGNNNSDFISVLMDHGLSFFEAAATSEVALGASRQIIPIVKYAAYKIIERPCLKKEILDEINGLVDEGSNLADAVQQGQKLRSVCMEVLRLNIGPTVERSGEHVKNEVVDGRPIHPTDRIIVSPPRLAKDPRIVGENPEDFDPNRWINQGAFWPNLPFLPFGGGRHLCPGWRLAVTQILQMVYLLVYGRETQN